MKYLLLVAIAASLFMGCSDNVDGRYPIDTMRMRTGGAGNAEPVNETFPLNAWFEIESGSAMRIHEGGVTSVYPNPKILRTVGGFEAMTENPRGEGESSWSFDKGEPGGFCSMTFTYDRIHFLTMLSKGRDTRR
jgi:hypothetical protein